MLVATALISTLLTQGLVLANPVSLEDRDPAIKVGYGQQIQNNDETNHWVVWVEGKDACPATQTLSVLNSSPCDQVFTLAGGSWKLTNCNGNNEPQSVSDDAGNYVTGCTISSDKINCHNGLHDIVKHGKCT